MTQRLRHVGITTIALLLAAAVTACSKVPLLAPSGSTINLSAASIVLPLNGTTGLTAFVTESSGTPVQNGTTVRFTTSLGSIQPVETQTINGLAVATFSAGGSSGIATVQAFSGGITGTTTTSGGATPPTATNVVTLTIGAAAVKTISVRASPSAVGPSGGNVTITAVVLDTNGGGVPGVPVSFSSDQGSLNPGIATTDTSGQAVTTLTTAQTTIVTASAGTATPATVTVNSRSGPQVTVTCTPAGGTATNCVGAAPDSSSNTATMVFTVTKATTSSNLRDATINFGDGTSQDLGTLGGGPSSVAHTYNGSSGSSPAAYTATVSATDVNGETASASTPVTVTPRGPLMVTLTATPTGRQVAFTATVTGGTAQTYVWDFGDGSAGATTSINTTSHVYGGAGSFTATVTVTTTDGRTGTGRAEFTLQ